MFIDSPFHRASSAGTRRSGEADRADSIEFTRDAPRASSAEIQRDNSLAARVRETDRQYDRDMQEYRHNFPRRDSFEGASNLSGCSGHRRRRSIELQPLGTRPPSPASTFNSSSEEKDSFSGLRTRSRAELEMFRRQADRRVHGRLQHRAQSAPSASMEETLPPPVPSPAPSHITINIDHASSSQPLPDHIRPHVQRTTTMRRARDAWAHILPDTESRLFKAFSLVVKIVLWVVLGGGAVGVTYTVAKNKQNIGDNRNIIDNTLMPPPPPPPIP